MNPEYSSNKLQRGLFVLCTHVRHILSYQSPLRTRNRSPSAWRGLNDVTRRAEKQNNHHHGLTLKILVTYSAAPRTQSATIVSPAFSFVPRYWTHIHTKQPRGETKRVRSGRVGSTKIVAHKKRETHHRIPLQKPPLQARLSPERCHIS